MLRSAEHVGNFYRKEAVMPRLSPIGQSVPLLPALPLIHRGKVRDTYGLPNGKRLVVASDRISIFDFVLNALVPGKGAVLTAMSHFFFRMLESHGIKTHLIAAGAAIDEHLPGYLHNRPELHATGMVVKTVTVHPVEFIARGYLTGSGLKEYRESGTVCGISLPMGLEDGDELPEAIATPTTKSEEGHDTPLDAVWVAMKYPWATERLLVAYQIASAFAKGRGVIIADTKLEFGEDEPGNTILADEAFTPDSSRFWDASAHRESRKTSPRKPPPPFDKQFVREWGKTVGINKLDPEKLEDVTHVHSLQVPGELIQRTQSLYLQIFERMIGMRLEKYQSSELGIAVPSAT